MTPYKSQIIRLLKSILLKPVDGSKRASAQFFPGKQGGPRFPGGMALSWWYSDDTFFARDDVASLTIQSSPDFKNCDHETVATVVMEAVQERCIDKSLFYTEKVAFADLGTLFACHKAQPLELADALCETIAVNLRAKIGRRCTIHVVPRLKVQSFQVEHQGLQLIARDDDEAWEAIIAAGFDLGGWSPKRPKIIGREDRSFSPPGDFHTLLVSDDVGTQAGTRFGSVLKFRKLAAVLHAVASRDAAYRLHKSAADSFEFLVQFPHQTMGERNLTRRDIDPVLPYFASDVEMSKEQTAEIKNWYAKAARCSHEHQARIDAAANFLNRGLNARDIEAYINYFVALDALFGQRGSVEASILDGVKALDLDKSFERKAEWLFDLRNELVHGASRYIGEWPKHSRYTQHFRTRPPDDVRTLAELAVLGAPRLFCP